VVYVAEMDPGIEDETVLATANERDALLVTADKDFGELIFRQGRIAKGIVLVRFPGLSAEEKAAAVSKAVELHADELAGAFSVITPGQVRIRKQFG